MNETTAKHYTACLIDRLPEKFLPDIAINLEATIKMVLGAKDVEIAKQNAEYLSMLDESFQQSKEGKGVRFSMEEFESFDHMTPEEIREFGEKRKLGLI